MVGHYTVTARPHPFRAESFRCVLPVGKTLREAAGGASQVAFTVNGAPCSPDVSPLAGADVTLVAIPAGDDGGGLLAQLALIAVSIYVPGAFGLTGLTANIASAAILGVGSVLLPRPATPKAARAPKQLHSISGARNDARPYEAVPMPYGRVRVYPPYAAQPYTEVVGGEQYVRLLFALSGDPNVWDVRVGETPIDRYDDAEYQVGIAPTLYPFDVSEEQFGIELEQTTPTAGTVATRTTAAADEISVDIVFPTGAAYHKKSGGREAGEHYFAFQYREEGAAAWLNVKDAPGLKLHGPVTKTASRFLVRSSSPDPQRIGVRWLTAARVRHEVRVSRQDLLHDGSPWGGPGQENLSKWGAAPSWVALRAVVREAPVASPGTKLLAIRMRASGQLNGIVDTVNCMCQQKIPVWTGAAWVKQATRSPVWAYVDVLTGTLSPRPVPKASLDVTALSAWAVDCSARGLRYDSVVAEQRTVWELLDEIAAAGLASRAVIDGQYTVVRDIAQSAPVQIFTPRNSWGFRSERTFPDQIHALKARFANEAAGYVEDEATIYADGYDENNASAFETITFPGAVSFDQVWTMGRYHLAALQLRPELMTLNADVEHIVCTRGDLVRVAFDVPLWGSGWGRLKAIAGDVLTLDDPVPVESGKSYVIRIRHADGSTHLSNVSVVVPPGVYQDTVTLITSDPSAVVGDLFLFGELGTDSARLLVTEVRPGPDLSARLTLVDEAPGIYSADTGPIPAHVPKITRPPNLRLARPEPPIITGVQSGENAMLVDFGGRLRARIVVSFTLPSLRAFRALSVEARYRLAGGQDNYRLAPPIDGGAGFVSITDVEVGAQYDIQIRCTSAGGVASEWIGALETVGGDIGPPSTPPWVRFSGNSLSWGKVDDVDVVGYLIRYHNGPVASWADAAPITVAPVTGPPYEALIWPTGDVTLLVVAVDRRGTVSTTPATVAVDFGAPSRANELAAQDDAAGGWPGRVEGGADVGGVLLADETTLMWGPDDAVLMWAADATSAMWPPAQYAQMQYFSEWQIPAAGVGYSLGIEHTLVAARFSIDYRENSAAMWDADDSVLMWAADDTTYMWDGGDWQPWPGALIAEDARYEFRLTLIQGATQGRIDEWTYFVTAPDIEEDFASLAIAAGGSRLALTRAYNAITSVVATVESGGAAETVEVVDYSVSLGPLLQGYDGAHSPAAAIANVRVRGY